MRTQLEKCLLKREAVELLSTTYDLLTVNDVDTFKSYCKNLQEFVGYGHSLCANGNLIEAVAQTNPNIDLLDVSYPRGFVEQYFNSGQHTSDALLKEFLSTNCPVNWLKFDKKYGSHYPAATASKEFGMNDGWAYGVVDPKNLDCTVFFLAGSDPNYDNRTEMIISYVVPFFAEAYKRVLNRKAKPTIRLTPREKEILQWFMQGKSSWETSVILKCSKRVIDFHARNILNKLDAANRTHAVVKALQQGIIHL